VGADKMALHRVWSGKRIRHVVLVCVVGLFAACEPQTNKGETEVEEVVRPARIETLQSVSSSGLVFNGTVRAAQRAELAFKVAGRVDKVMVDEGASVTAGQELARLDDREFRTVLASAQAEFATADADYRRGQAIYERSQAISRRDLEKLETQRNLVANRLRSAQLALDETLLKAPFDGIVGRKLVEDFSRVGANQTVLVVQNLQDLEVVIQVPDRVVLQSSGSSDVYAEISGLDQTFPLSLKFFSTEADPTTQTYQVILGLDGKGDARILPGMSARVFSDSGSAANAGVTVPLGAIVPNNQGQQFVWKLDVDNRAQRANIEAGQLSGDRVVVTSGLQPGDRIITAGVSSVREGMKVRPLQGNGVSR